MRLVFTLLGISGILAYAVVGALFVNDWAVTAASGLPLDETLAEMSAANQPHNTVAGIAFAVIGGVLALIWGALTLLPRFALPVRVSLVMWAAIIALGAPAFFMASFPNMNSVGDTFWDWNSEAAFALELPLYLASFAAVLVAGFVPVITAIRKPRKGGNSVDHTQRAMFGEVQ